VSEAGPQTLSWGAHLRGLLVGLHVLAVVLVALPAPEGGMNRASWADPTVQAEFQAWADRLGALGLDLGPEEIEQQAWTLAQAWTKGRNVVLKPIRPYTRYLGTNQPWRMFVAPHTHPSRLHIELREAEGWRTIYIARDPTLDWRADQLGHDRARSALFRYAWPGYSRSWKQLSRWLAERAAEDFPQATHLRLRFARQQSPSPEEVRAGFEHPRTWGQTRTYELGPIRAGELGPIRAGELGPIRSGEGR